MFNKTSLNDKQIDFYSKHTVSCKCGHRVCISNKNKKVICSWCGNMVYLDKKDEFKNRLKTAIKKI